MLNIIDQDSLWDRLGYRQYTAQTVHAIKAQIMDGHKFFYDLVRDMAVRFVAFVRDDSMRVFDRRDIRGAEFGSPG